jgi:hypothetical protein
VKLYLHRTRKPNPCFYLSPSKDPNDILSACRFLSGKIADGPVSPLGRDVTDVLTWAEVNGFDVHDGGVIGAAPEPEPQPLHADRFVYCLACNTAFDSQFRKAEHRCPANTKYNEGPRDAQPAREDGVRTADRDSRRQAEAGVQPASQHAAEGCAASRESVSIPDQDVKDSATTRATSRPSLKPTIAADRQPRAIGTASSFMPAAPSAVSMEVN